jgi:16S rRNA (guanine527-N7)-methyltransferase
VTGTSPDPAPSTPPPAAIADALGSRLPLAQQYVDVLLSDGVRRGLIGPREHGRVWERHLANSLALAPLIPLGARVVDVGTGAGLP